MAGDLQKPTRIAQMLAKQKGTPRQQMDLYFKFLGQLVKEKDERKKFMFCQLSIPLIPALIEETKREFGRFDLTSIPALEVGYRLAKEFGAFGQLQNLREFVDSFAELAPWKKRFTDLDERAARRPQ